MAKQFGKTSVKILQVSMCTHHTLATATLQHTLSTVL